MLFFSALFFESVSFPLPFFAKTESDPAKNLQHVGRRENVKKTNWKKASADSDCKDLVSLVTCTPYGINTHRLVVTGERIEYKESTAKNVKAELMSFRELFFTALPFLFIGYAAFQIVKSRRKMKRETKQILQDEED